MRGSVPDRVLMALEADGGWLTFEGLSLLLPPVNAETIYRALYRLRDRGLVATRTVELATSASHCRSSIRCPFPHVESRREWSAA